MKIQDIIDKFDKELAKLQKDYEFDNNGETKIHKFGQRIFYKEVDGSGSYWIITDFGNIKQFLKDSLTSMLDGMIEKVETKQEDFRDYQDHDKWELCQEVINMINSHR